MLAEDDGLSKYGGYFENQDEDFDEDDEEDPIKSAERHQEELRLLQRHDPELYKYLLKSQPDMLKFDTSQDNEPALS
eukprot:UN06679